MELPQEAQVVLEKKPQIADAVAKHREPVRSHAEREALVPLRIDVHGLQHVRVNLPSAGVEYQLPFGGTKGSSFGPKEQGPSALDFYSDWKTIYLKY